jgi:hypothetical protein
VNNSLFGDKDRIEVQIVKDLLDGEVSVYTTVHLYDAEGDHYAATITAEGGIRFETHDLTYFEAVPEDLETLLEVSQIVASWQDNEPLTKKAVRAAFRDLTWAIEIVVTKATRDENGDIA